MKLIIEKERIRRDWKVSFIADEIGITKSAVSQILNGHIKPSYNILVKLENLFKLPHTELFKQFDENNNTIYTA